MYVRYRIRSCLQVLYALDAKVDFVLGSTIDGDNRWSDLAQQPPVKFALTTYQSVHDTVVSTPAYTRCSQLQIFAPRITCCTSSCIDRPAQCSNGMLPEHNLTASVKPCHRVLELGEGTLTRVHESSLYKSIQPLVGPLAEPAVKRILDSPTFQVCWPLL